MAISEEARILPRCAAQLSPETTKYIKMRGPLGALTALGTYLAPAVADMARNKAISVAANY
jgi:hypothetical protein